MEELDSIVCIILDSGLFNSFLHVFCIIYIGVKILISFLLPVPVGVPSYRVSQMVSNGGNILDAYGFVNVVSPR